MNYTKGKWFEYKVIMTELDKGQNDYEKDVTEEYNDELELELENICNIQWWSRQDYLEMTGDSTDYIFG